MDLLRSKVHFCFFKATVDIQKKQLHRLCLDYVSQRINTAQAAIDEAQASANDETKSSAGDKYETGRSMMQLEMEKHAAQLTEALRSRQVLLQIDPDIKTDRVQLGSVVVTNNGNFFISVSAGQLTVEGKKYFSVSLASPIGMKLLGSKAGDTFQFNNMQYRIESVG